jgi:hypothetical protein
MPITGTTVPDGRFVSGTSSVRGSIKMGTLSCETVAGDRLRVAD